MGAHDPRHYFRIYSLLVALLAVSVLGPMLEIRWLTLVTAFGVAGIKAVLVARHFMHLSTEKRWVSQVLILALAMMVVFFFGVAPDIMEHEGLFWEHHVQPSTPHTAGGH
jgi:caa(3)-type oxidase subunit IV